jgi:auxin influx carrier (AUX1 LAX family)
MNGFSVWSSWVLSCGYVVREIMEATRRPSKFKFVYLAVVFYTFSVTIPSAVSTYWAFGDILLHRSNAFAVLPPSPWRTFAIVSIILHQVPLFSAALCL